MASEQNLSPAWVIARLARQVELAATQAELTLSQYRVMMMLAEASETASVLADKLAVGKPSLTGVVDGLVQRGLVARGQDPHDRRRISLTLTDAGHTLLSTADAEVERRLNDVAAYCPQGPEAAFAGLAPWQEALEGYRQVRRAQIRAELRAQADQTQSGTQQTEPQPTEPAR